MLINISVTRLNNAGVQICVAKPQANPSAVQTYASIEAARGVLLDFGINEEKADSTLKLLPEIGPQEVLRFSAVEVPQSLLEKHGYKLSAH